MRFSRVTSGRNDRLRESYVIPQKRVLREEASPVQRNKLIAPFGASLAASTARDNSRLLIKKDREDRDCVRWKSLRYPLKARLPKRMQSHEMNRFSLLRFISAGVFRSAMQLPC